MRTRTQTVLLLSIPILIGLIMASDETKTNGGKHPPPPPPKPPSPPNPMPPKTGPAPPLTVIPGGLIDQLAEHPGATREAQVQAIVRDGTFDTFRWTNVHSVGEKGTELEGWTLAVPVMSDAFKVEGVRVEGTFRLYQWIADTLGLALMTPFVAGLVSEQTDTPGVTPSTGAPVDGTKARMLRANAEIDAKLAAYPGAKLVLNQGKDHVLTIKFASGKVHPQSGVQNAKASANHGLYNSPWHPIQNVGMAHPAGVDGEPGYEDYSEMMRWLGPMAILIGPDGIPRPKATKAIVMDPEFAPLLTGRKGAIRGAQVGEGVLPYDRHPRLPPVPTLVA